VEVEIHAGHPPAGDGFGQSVGILVGIIGILLAVVTILGHREHTAAVVHRTEANDQWAYYQAKKIREHTAETAGSLLDALASDPQKVAPVADRLQQDAARYAKDAEGIQKVAEDRDAQSAHAEARALRFDLGEGFLELGLVLSSLYFLSRRRQFVGLGAVSAVVGTVTGIAGLLT
jgi:uncharacterized membrane-anchored protein YhcB (DUF1043 family)